MRQHHQAGEKLFVDYCGPTVPIVNPDTGEVRQAQIFIGALGASNYTYAEVKWSQQQSDWINAHDRMFEFLGGVLEIVVPDNLKSTVLKTHRSEPDLNPAYQQTAAHYQVAVIPAGPCKPKDKARLEVVVLIVERWTLARIRHQIFFTLFDLNTAISALPEYAEPASLQEAPRVLCEHFESVKNHQERICEHPEPASRYTIAACCGCYSVVRVSSK